jgi:hypothetical protein
MNTSIALPSGKILNISRFVALLPPSSTDNQIYHLILEGYPSPIHLELSDVEVLTKQLELEKDNIATTHQLGWDKEKQLQKNQRAMELLAKRIEQHKHMSDAESLQRQQFFEQFKKIVDEQRLPGHKLYSES